MKNADGSVPGNGKLSSGKAPPQDAGAGQSSPDTPTGPVGQPWRPADSSKQAIWEGSPALELDFLPDSEIQDALEAPGFEAPPEQVRTSLIYSHMPQGRRQTATSPPKASNSWGKRGTW